jgi:hypothetical protein
MQQVLLVFITWEIYPNKMFVSTFGLTRKLFHPRSISRIWLARSAHPDLSHCRVSHPVTSTIFQHSQTPPIQCSQSPTIPQTKWPELVVATKEGNCREIKTGWQSATCNLGVLLIVVCYSTQKAKDQSGLKYRQECHHVIFCCSNANRWAFTIVYEAV